MELEGEYRRFVTVGPKKYCCVKGDGSYEIVPGLEVNDWLRERMKKSEEELTSEKGCVGHLVGEAHVDVPDAGCPVDLEDTLLPGEM